MKIVGIVQNKRNMMNESKRAEQERSILRWGGLAGMVGGLLFILTWVVVIVGPVGMEDPADLAGWVTRFPDIRAARVVENGLYLVALMLEVTLFLALYRALQRTSLAPALFGRRVSGPLFSGASWAFWVLAR
ncbi:MAG: hypothetical protein P8189_26920 [Anaerolineae bacterium]